MGQAFGLRVNSVLKIISIPLDRLIINPDNDRHGHTPSQEDAIDWLFQHKPNEMRKLAQNIAKSGGIFDIPLVVEHGDYYLIKDGNRRVTCLKLIADPSRAPEKAMSLFNKLSELAKFDQELMVDCQLAESENTADIIIGLRHNGTQNGVGQLNWGIREKAIHANRTSGKSDYTIAQLVENFLIERGKATEAATINRSSLAKIIDTKARQRRLGLFAGADGKLQSTQAANKTLALIERLVNDMKSGNLTLKNLLNSKSKNLYIDTLEAAGLLPDDETPPPLAPPPPPSSPTLPSPTKPLSVPPAPSRPKRETLIPKVDYNLNWSSDQQKISQVWNELQHDLKLARTKSAIAALFRVLLELVTYQYIKRNNLQNQNGLAKNLGVILRKLVADGKIDKKSETDINRILTDKTAVNSIENLQRYLHSSHQMPAADDLISMWDSISPLVVAALRS